VDLTGIKILAMSPGLSPLEPKLGSFLALAREKQLSIWGELDFFQNALKSLAQIHNYLPKIIAITGTNGKTTTTAMTGVICSRTGKNVAVAGNISPSLLDKLVACLESNLLPDIWVLELSSYQLFYSNGFNPHAAVVLNISEDHLDWHGSMMHYAQAKAKIFGPDTIPILNRDDARVMELLSKEDWDKKRIITFGMGAPREADSFGIKGDMSGSLDWLAWAPPTDEYDGNRLIKARRTKKSQALEEEPLTIKQLIPADALRIKGRHNALNALAALGFSKCNWIQGLHHYCMVLGIMRVSHTVFKRLVLWVMSNI
jgi:UDP-N-acetylmuramoylalanine--D-glutamate ligase